MIFHHGCLPLICHNKLRNLTTSWLQKVYHDVVVEPPFSHSLARSLFLHLLIAGMMLGQISMPETFGVDNRLHFLILGCFISMHLAIIKLR